MVLVSNNHLPVRPRELAEGVLFWGDPLASGQIFPIQPALLDHAPWGLWRFKDTPLLLSTQ
jgi:hypothetical protein